VVGQSRVRGGASVRVAQGSILAVAATAAVAPCAPPEHASPLTRRGAGPHTIRAGAVGGVDGSAESAGQPSVTSVGGATSRAREEHTSELQSLTNLVCRLLLEKKKKRDSSIHYEM